EIDVGKAARFTEYHCRLARVAFEIAESICGYGSDDDVVEAVAVDVSGRRHRETRLVDGIRAEDTESLGRRQRGRMEVVCVMVCRIGDRRCRGADILAAVRTVAVIEREGNLARQC